MASRNEEVLREAFMTKRSQNKSPFTPTNWKDRWFVLTPHNLIYYDGDRNSGRKREKGRVDLSKVWAVESVEYSAFQKDLVFQLVYGSTADTESVTLYIAASSAHDHDDWLEHIRSLVGNNTNLAEVFHKGALLRNQWSCCRGPKDAVACTPVTWTRNNNATPGMLCPEVDRSGRPRRYCYDQPSPSPPLNQDNMLPYQVPGVRTAFGPYRKKIVVAIYDYNPTEIGDLPLRKNEEYEVLQDAEENWWRMRNRNGEEGYAPSNYVKEKASLGLQQYDWYLGDATRQRAEFILKREEKEGCFVVRNSTTTTGMYTLSVYSKQPTPQVKHYHIKREGDLYYLSQSIKCRTIPDLIFKHKYNPGGLCTRLRSPPTHGRQPPTTAGISHDKWEIDPNELNLLEELGSGQFGVVRHGKLKCMDVAVKMMKEGTMSEEAFIEEAKVMTQLQHTNLVQLYGVCSRHRPIYIVTEYLRYGSLLLYLRQKEKHLITCSEQLLDMCLQVCEGMAYLEKQRFIHRDLAARNCLVGSQGVIKVGDFGLARYVVDDEYAGSGGAKFPIKWAAPEVLNYMRFSSKSDVWAFGVLMWEVFTCGRMPYGKLRNAEVVDRVQSGQVLERPTYCPETVYELMKLCWTHDVDRRPSFADMRCQIVEIQEA
ncbi:tyrosine-protein kinase Btk29A isoform X9 [Oratosquilla oratoria]|uniref:tyrosine-protein kinase Btk29A isoform X9 n=1 Tax=Oratosquilla oratoria TaxID=337810 RepID=UPI003F767123